MNLNYLYNKSVFSRKMFISQEISSSFAFEHKSWWEMILLNVHPVVNSLVNFFTCKGDNLILTLIRSSIFWKDFINRFALNVSYQLVTTTTVSIFSHWWIIPFFNSHLTSHMMLWATADIFELYYFDLIAWWLGNTLFTFLFLLRLIWHLRSKIYMTSGILIWGHMNVSTYFSLPCCVIIVYWKLMKLFYRSSQYTLSDFTYFKLSHVYFVHPDCCKFWFLLSSRRFRIFCEVIE